MNLFSIINILFEYPGVYFKLNEEDKKKLIENMEDYYSLSVLFGITHCFSGCFESVLVDMKPDYLKKYSMELLNNEFVVFNVPGDRYREFLIDNIDNLHYLKKSKIYKDIAERYGYFYINVEGLYKTLVYLESQSNDLVKEILSKKNKQLRHRFFWLDVRKELSDDKIEYIEKYHKYMIEKMESAGMKLKDVLHFSGIDSAKNKKTVFTELYFSYALEKEPETADMIMNHFLNSGANEELIDQLKTMKSQKEKEDLISKIKVSDKKEKISRI